MAKPSDDLLATCERTFASLDAAIAEGNDDVLFDTAEQVATKLSDKIGVPIKLLVPIIQAWLTARRLKLGIRA